jgi:hypothetical protein
VQKYEIDFVLEARNSAVLNSIEMHCCILKKIKECTAIIVRFLTAN